MRTQRERDEILQAIYQAKNRFRVDPKKEYLGLMVEYFFSERQMTGRQVEMVLKRASELYDSFPSIAQINTISDQLRKEGQGDGRQSESRIKYKPCLECDGYGLLYLIDETGGRWVHSCEQCANGSIQRELSNLSPKASQGLRRGLKRRDAQGAKRESA